MNTPVVLAIVAVVLVVVVVLFLSARRRESHELQERFGPEYELTLVARYTKAQYADADVLVTTDDLEKVIAVIRKLKDRPARAKPGQCWDDLE